MSVSEFPKITSLANWFGSSRESAERIAAKIGRQSLVVIPFAGGCSEIPHIDANRLIVNDSHRHIINLARVIADRTLCGELLERLTSTLFHPDVLDEARATCLWFEDRRGNPVVDLATSSAPSVGWAYAYWINTWMSRGGNGGTPREFKGKLPIRFSPHGGGSSTRFWSAVGGIEAWSKILGRAEFSTDDAFDVIAKTTDDEGVCLYCDPPWVEVGEVYTHGGGFDHRRLSTDLSRFTKTRVVVRYGDCPLVRELYPLDRWNIDVYPSRRQSNSTFDEVLICNAAPRQEP